MSTEHQRRASRVRESGRQRRQAPREPGRRRDHGPRINHEGLCASGARPSIEILWFGPVLPEDKAEELRTIAQRQPWFREQTGGADVNIETELLPWL